MTGVILEIASGSGEHVVHFARHFPALVFQPSDPEPDALLSVAALVKATRATKVRVAPDASQSVWQIASLTASGAFATEPELGLRDLEAVGAMARGRTQQSEDSTSADGRTAMESVMSRGFAV